MKVVLDDGARLPERAHNADAGFDLFARETAVIQPGGSYVFDTGVHMEIPYKFAGLVVSKSGLNVNHGLTSEGLIDAGYRGSIRVKLYNNSKEAYTVNAGDKISQIMIVPIFTPKLEIVDSLSETKRGSGGFGSTGK